jgi:hypothetical protein
MKRAGIDRAHVADARKLITCGTLALRAARIDGVPIVSAGFAFRGRFFSPPERSAGKIESPRERLRGEEVRFTTTDTREETPRWSIAIRM